MSMFGQPDDVLIEGLENLRKSLCAYGSMATTCDCKYGASGKGEQTGCPEIRQAIAIISGQRDQVIVMKERMEASATNTMRNIRSVIEAFYEEDFSDT